MEKLILFLIISLIPILGWLWFFNKEHHTKKNFVVITFFAGMLSIIPIKFYEKYWEKSFLSLENINLFYHIEKLANSPMLSELLSFISVGILVALLLFVFTTVMMFVFEIFSGDNIFSVFKKKTKQILEEPFLFMSVGAIIGMLAFLFSGIFPLTVWQYMVIGILEEFIKHLVVRFSDEEKIQSVADAISYSIIVALGFSFIENTIYFLKFLESSAQVFDINFIRFFLARSIIPTLGHICFSAIFGYFYGLSKFAKDIYFEEKHSVIKKIEYWLHLKGITIYHKEKMMQGLFCAMFVHAIFNILLEFEQIAGVLILLLICFLFVIKLLNTKKYNIIHRT